MRWLPRRPEDLPPDERAIYERSKTMPPIAAPPTVCPLCRILIHDQFLDCHCTYRDGAFCWARCALLAAHTRCSVWTARQECVRSAQKT